MDRSSLFRKGLAVAVILLFVGVSVVPSTGTCVDTDIDYNNPPTAPIFLGQTHGVAGEEYPYTINSTDPDGDDVWYYIDWGEPDHDYEWIGPYDSGEEVVVSYTWEKRGTYYVSSQARDVYNATSDFTIVEVIIRKIIYVDDDNTEGPWNGTIEYPYQYIQDGIDNASGGDTVFVYSGIYYENIIVNKSITLIGENKNTTIIGGMRKDNVVYVIVNGVSINGFTIQNGAGVPGSFAGVYLFSDNNIVYNNIIKENGIRGIELYHSDNNTIYENILSNNDCEGISLCKSNKNSIHNNIISGNTWGIDFIYSEYNFVYENIIDLNFNGIDLYHSGSNKIYGNSITNSNQGIILRYPPSDQGYTLPNKIYHNNFFDNTRNAYDEGDNTWDNGYPSGGNHWDDFDEPNESAYDEFHGENQDHIGKDGIVDQGWPTGGLKPYYISKNNKDWYPIMSSEDFGEAPEISDIILVASEPLDTDIGWENISCIVIDNDGNIDNVKFTIIWPDCAMTAPMINIPETDIYYFNTSFPIANCYNYYIYANDTYGNMNKSSMMQFWLPHNADVNMDGRIGLIDLIRIILKWRNTGSPGWIREDVNNDGRVDFIDFITVLFSYFSFILSDNSLQQ